MTENKTPAPSTDVEGWQDISTAPKTGEEFIGRTGSEWSGFSCFWDGQAFVHLDPEDGVIRYTPTEWMPIPGPSPAPQDQLVVTNPTTIAQFVGALADHGVKLPLLPTDDDAGTLVDADGRPVLVVDVNRERSDEDVAWIVSMIQVAVNTCGGFKAQRQGGSE